MMKTMRGGFSLIELIMALVLSTFVLVGIITVASQMIRYEMEGSSLATVSNWDMVSMQQMSLELQNGTSLVSPSEAAPTSAVLSGCGNFSQQQLNTIGGTGKLDPLAGISSFYYCVWPAGSTPTGTPWLLHYSCTPATNPNCTCPMATPTCGQGTYDVVAQNIWPLNPSNNYYFVRADDVSGVQVEFTVGCATPTYGTSGGSAPSTCPKNVQVPRYVQINTKIGMQKSYTDKAD
jgi:hypothetical protein